MTNPMNDKENARVEFLRSLNLLDTAPDKHLDRIVGLASRIFAAPISDISIIDQDRQWFKSRQGLEIDETAREDSFCNITIANDGIFEVPDATKHEILKTNPYVVGEPYIRYYMGAPITVSGFRIGALCIMATEPRDPASKSDRETLLDLAAIASREIYLQHLLRETIPVVVNAAITTSVTTGTGTVVSEGTGTTTSSGMGTTTTTGTGTTTTTGTGSTTRTGSGTTVSQTPGLEVTTTSDAEEADKAKSVDKKSSKKK
jgi:hypothetical protein